MRMVKHSTIAIIVLSVLLVLSLGYIGFAVYTNAKIAEQNQIYQQGVQFGYQQAVVDLVNSASTCQQVPVRVNENVTVNMIAVGCLQ